MTELAEPTDAPDCPKCGGDDVVNGRYVIESDHGYGETWYWLCADCGHEWGHE